MSGKNLLLALPMVTLIACATESIDQNGPVGPDSGLDDGGEELDGPTESVDAPGPGAPPVPGECAGALVESFEGTASRSQDDGYPDHIAVMVTWQRTGTDGCVDSYAPTGTATYGYAVPGALCEQRIEPDTHGVVATDGALTIDRTTSPPTFNGAATTHWPVTWTCVEADGTVNRETFDGGAAWFGASGTVDDGALRGAYTSDDDEACGPEGIAPCTYRWSFTPES